jgi:hypothetical protein
MGGFVSKTVDAATGGILDLQGKGGQQAASATTQAAQTAAAAQMEALDFLKSQAVLPTEIRDQALRGLQSFYFDPQAQAQFQDTPFYQEQLRQGEEALLRNQAATGMLRSGGTIEDLPQVGQAIQEQYLGGLRGLAGLDTSAGQIANLTGQVGQTQAAGISGAAQAQLAADQARRQTLVGLGQGAAMAFSDDRLKDNTTKTSNTSIEGINKYKWNWNKHAETLGMKGSDSGYIASEIERVWPDLVEMHSSGYRMINLPEIEKRLSEASNG